MHLSPKEERSKNLLMRTQLIGLMVIPAIADLHGNRFLIIAVLRESDRVGIWANEIRPGKIPATNCCASLDNIMRASQPESYRRAIDVCIEMK